MINPPSVAVALAAGAFSLSLAGPPPPVAGLGRRVPMQGEDSVQVVLAEVLFSPAAGDTAFVELADVGTRPIDLTAFVLRVDTLDLPFPRLATPFAPGATSDWVTYAPGQVTPGQPNPLPPVPQMLPLDGAILQAQAATLSWYPVAGATRYRVQLAKDTSFTQPLLDQTVDQPSLATGPLAPGVYRWRVEALGAERVVAGWSRPSRLELERPTGGGQGRGGRALPLSPACVATGGNWTSLPRLVRGSPGLSRSTTRTSTAFLDLVADRTRGESGPGPAAHGIGRLEQGRHLLVSP